MNNVYPSPQDELFDAVRNVTGYTLTIDQCNDILSELRLLGYEVVRREE